LENEGLQIFLAGGRKCRHRFGCGETRSCVDVEDEKVVGSCNSEENADGFHSEDGGEGFVKVQVKVAFDDNVGLVLFKVAVRIS
jgi:hypothetical protein